MKRIDIFYNGVAKFILVVALLRFAPLQNPKIVDGCHRFISLKKITPIPGAVTVNSQGFPREGLVLGQNKSPSDFIGRGHVD
jgi:hypothetical protein